MKAEEFARIAAPLAELEDYLIDQQRYAIAVGHPMDANVMMKALQLAIRAHAEAQSMIHETMQGEGE